MGCHTVLVNGITANTGGRLLRNQTRPQSHDGRDIGGTLQLKLPQLPPIRHHASLNLLTQGWF